MSVAQETLSAINVKIIPQKSILLRNLCHCDIDGYATASAKADASATDCCEGQ